MITLVKMADHESLGIQEYWIVDYLGLGGRRYIGSPKQPTITICNLVDGEYDLQQLRRDDRIQSPTFPELQLTVTQIFWSWYLKHRYARFQDSLANFQSLLVGPGVKTLGSITGCLGWQEHIQFFHPSTFGRRENLRRKKDANSFSRFLGSA